MIEPVENQPNCLPDKKVSRVTGSNCPEFMLTRIQFKSSIKSGEALLKFGEKFNTVPVTLVAMLPTAKLLRKEKNKY